jgi:hypothetical protein
MDIGVVKDMDTGEVKVMSIGLLRGYRSDTDPLWVLERIRLKFMYLNVPNERLF